MFWLLLIGLLHGHLIWYGDILVVYAMCGMILYPCRFLPGWAALLLAIVIIGIGSAISLGIGQLILHLEPEHTAEMASNWQPNTEAITKELAIYRGSYLEQASSRSATALMIETFLFVILFFWRAGGMMLLGMALYKFGFFKASAKPVVLTAMVVIGFTAGWGLSGWGVVQNEAGELSFNYSQLIRSQFNYWGSLFSSLAMMAVIVLIGRNGWLTRLSNRLASVGRMALTNYLLQSIVCTLIFYGHGLGYFGYASRVEQILLVAAIWAAQLLLTPIWLRRFRFGPVEWAWRSLSYWRRQPQRI